ncbi:ATP-binding protein [Robiginitalea sp. M366]|uniref:sensor histidine kinase n=1 Tax=Robiginitalea aestuariiviva TaxID=3036903 RepID=UPI00240DC058|nr:ATP-binding protein [Robiginitalea aestuariiviva]MDG1572477.1 ATP-binding protein [Robiginitalea aestuariiviva]
MPPTNPIAPLNDHAFMDDLFPFFILMDREARIVRVGRSMAKMGLVQAGDDFFEDFTVERPLQTATFQDILRQRGSLFILNPRRELGFKFRGQMYADGARDQIYFLGSPLIHSFDDLRQVDLGLNDFALHDNISQFLFTTQMHLSSLKDSRNIATRLEKTNQDLQQKNTELQDFAHILSHDLKSPIQGILSLTEFMQQDMALNKLDELPFFLQTIQERVIRMNSLIEGILEFSKIGLEKSKKEDIDLNALVRDAFTDILPPEGFTYRIADTLPTVHNIRVLYVQLFSNLISNAVKYNDKVQGEITIGYEEGLDFHAFRVSDNGPGISESYHEKIFELFQTLNPADQIQGTGVGLSIVKKIVTLLEGSIRVESKVGEGTTFLIRLPKS